MGACLDLTGQGCLELVQLTKNDSIFLDILNNHTARKTTLTRIDIAADDFQGILDMEIISGKVQRGEVRTRLHKRTEYRSIDGTAGHTVYLGAPSSNVRIRIYDKAAQQQTAFPWIRTEMVLRHEAAQEFQKFAVETISPKQPERNDALARLGIQVLKGKLAFIEPTDRNISRCAVSPWWEQFLAEIEPVHLIGQEAKIPAIEQTSEWLEKQIAPTLALMVCMLGPDWFSTLLASGCSRIDTARAATWCQELEAFGMAPEISPDREDLPEAIRHAILENLANQK